MRKLQLLGQRLPVTIETSIPIRMSGVQFWGLHDDGVQIPNPVRMNTWLGTMSSG